MFRDRVGAVTRCTRCVACTPAILTRLRIGPEEGFRSPPAAGPRVAALGLSALHVASIATRGETPGTLDSRGKKATNTMRIPAALAVTAFVILVPGARAECIGDGALHASLPASASAGACFARVSEPNVQTITEQVLVKPAGERIEVIPARYEVINESVLVEEATTRTINSPAHTEWIEDPVLVEPAHSSWRKSDCSAVGAVRNGTGECACLVTTPDRWETRRRLVSVPASSSVIAVPARYETVQRTVMASPAREVRVSVPAEVTTVTREVQLPGERSGWTQIACNAGPPCSIDAAATARLERRLRDMGYEPGVVDGVFDVQARNALSAYQIDTGLVPGSCQDVAYLQRVP